MTKSKECICFDLMIVGRQTFERPIEIVVESSACVQARRYMHVDRVQESCSTLESNTSSQNLQNVHELIAQIDVFNLPWILLRIALEPRKRCYLQWRVREWSKTNISERLVYLFLDNPGSIMGTCSLHVPICRLDFAPAGEDSSVPIILWAYTSKWKWLYLGKSWPIARHFPPDKNLDRSIIYSIGKRQVWSLHRLQSLLCRSSRKMTVILQYLSSVFMNVAIYHFG